MKEVAILLLFALSLGGCGSSSNKAQTAASDTWQAVLSGGIGSASGFSFNTQFTVNSDGSLNIETFQFLNQDACFPIDGTGDAESGTMDLTVTTSGQVTGTFTYTITGNGNTLTLNGTVSGTEVNSTLSGTSITGTWTLTGTSSCSDSTGGSFTMSQPTTSSST
jgi:hypothetical protein